MMRDQIPLHRPLFGVEPSGHIDISNSYANLLEWLFSAVFCPTIADLEFGIVKNSDTSAIPFIASMALAQVPIE